MACNLRAKGYNILVQFILKKASYNLYNYMYKMFIYIPDLLTNLLSFNNLHVTFLPAIQQLEDMN